MWKNVKKGLFPFIIAFSALSVSASAAFYSVYGLSKLFAGAQFEVIIMAGSLEVAKLVIASLLYQYWDTINKALRAYLTVAAIILVIITSMGIYGFLSAAYQETYANLLISDNKNSAEKLALEIEGLNTLRREIEKEITIQAADQVDNSDDKLNSIIVFDSKWNKGVIGIVASRLVDKYYKPSIVFCESSKGYLTASARSIKGVDLYSILDGCKEHIDQFGGHKYAAGLTIKKDNLEKFKTKFEKIVSKRTDNNIFEQELQIETKINLSEITPKFFRILKQFAPFGPQNLSPVFMTTEVYDTGYGKCIGEDQTHLRVTLTQKRAPKIVGIGFGLGVQLPIVKSKAPFKIVYSIDENEWNGRVSLQLKLKDLKL